MKSPLIATKVRQEIAVRAARYIAEDGVDYARAKRQAVESLLGVWPRDAHSLLPSNQEVEAQVRVYQRLFQADTQPQRLLHLRRTALACMRWLQAWVQSATEIPASAVGPFLVGAVWNGSATAHSSICLELYLDSSKELAIFLLNEAVVYTVKPVKASDVSHRSGEFLEFNWQNELICLSVYEFGRSRQRFTLKSPRALSEEALGQMNLPTYLVKERANISDLDCVVREMTV